MTHNNLAPAEAAYGPESQFDKTVGYLDRLLEEHGQAPVEGELYRDGVESSMRIDPEGKDPERAGYRLKDVHITKMHDGMRIVRADAYNTYRFDPATGKATKTFFMHSLTPDVPSMEPHVTELDDDAQRALMVKISDAMRNGTVSPHKPIFPGVVAKLLAAAKARLHSKDRQDI